MEKYGVDMSNLPVTDDQLREIRKLCKEANVDFEMPKNRKHADELIEKLAGEIDG
jgi:hypothetical protein